MVAVRDHLRSEMDLSAQECMVLPDPRPIPSCGQRFISIYGTNWSPSEGDNNRSLFENYDLACGVTFRSGYVPYDRMGDELYIKTIIGLEDFCRTITSHIHQNPSILTSTNEDIDDQFPGMLEYLRWEGTDASPRFVTGEWFTSEDPQQTGLFMEVRFGQATRFLPFDSQRGF